MFETEYKGRKVLLKEGIWYIDGEFWEYSIYANLEHIETSIDALIEAYQDIN